MGRSLSFLCPDCGYRVEHISGGIDCGFESVVQTVSCPHCHGLSDCLISTDPSGVLRHNPTRLRHDFLPDLSCPVCGAKDVTPWNDPGPCPRCGETMEMDIEGPIALWD